MGDDDLTAVREAQRIVHEAERERLAAWARLREKVMAAFERGDEMFSVTLPPLQWMDLIDEVENLPARNMSRLIRDDFLDQMRAIIERMHREWLFMIALGNNKPIASRMDDR